MTYPLLNSDPWAEIYGYLNNCALWEVILVHLFFFFRAKLDLRSMLDLLFSFTSLIFFFRCRLVPIGTPKLLLLAPFCPWLSFISTEASYEQGLCPSAYLELRYFRALKLRALEALATSCLIYPECRTKEILHDTPSGLRGSTTLELRDFGENSTLHIHN